MWLFVYYTSKITFSLDGDLMSKLIETIGLSTNLEFLKASVRWEGDKLLSSTFFFVAVSLFFYGKYTHLYIYTYICVCVYIYRFAQ